MLSLTLCNVRQGCLPSQSVPCARNATPHVCGCVTGPSLCKPLALLCHSCSSSSSVPPPAVCKGVNVQVSRHVSPVPSVCISAARLRSECREVDKGPDFWNTSVKDCEPLLEWDCVWCMVVHCLTWRAPNLTRAMHFCGADINAAVTPSLPVSFAIALLCAVFS